MVGAANGTLALSRKLQAPLFDEPTQGSPKSPVLAIALGGPRWHGGKPERRVVSGGTCPVRAVLVVVEGEDPATHMTHHDLP